METLNCLDRCVPFTSKVIRNFPNRLYQKPHPHKLLNTISLKESYKTCLSASYPTGQRFSRPFARSKDKKTVYPIHSLSSGSQAIALRQNPVN